MCEEKDIEQKINSLIVTDKKLENEGLELTVGEEYEITIVPDDSKVSK